MARMRRPISSEQNRLKDVFPCALLLFVPGKGPIHVSHPCQNYSKLKTVKRIQRSRSSQTDRGYAKNPIPLLHLFGSTKTQHKSQLLQALCLLSPAFRLLCLSNGSLVVRDLLIGLLDEVAWAKTRMGSVGGVQPHPSRV